MIANRIIALPADVKPIVNWPESRQIPINAAAGNAGLLATKPDEYIGEPGESEFAEVLGNFQERP
jgi:hypothetical protein